MPTKKKTTKKALSPSAGYQAKFRAAMAASGRKSVTVFLNEEARAALAELGQGRNNSEVIEAALKVALQLWRRKRAE